MQLPSSRPGEMATTEEKIDHIGYPCPPSRHPDVSCSDAWERWARGTGREIVIGEALDVE